VGKVEMLALFFGSNSLEELPNKVKVSIKTYS